MISSKGCWIWVGIIGTLLFSTIALSSVSVRKLKEYGFNYLDDYSNNKSEFLDTVFEMEREEEELDSSMPTYKLYSNNNSEVNGNKEKFGGRYGKLLVDTSNDDSWWKWSFKRKDLYLEKGEAFKDIKSKSEENQGSTYLKEECKKIYAKEEKDVAGEDLKNTWLFCSPIGKKPFTLNELTTGIYKNKFGSIDETHTRYLISNRPGNKNTWLQMFKNLFKQEEISSYSNEFKEVKSGYKAYYDKNEISLNFICNLAYLKTKEEVERVSQYKTDVFKFCSLSV